ncbi:unnamed protein product, partial [marine sediment metagenome]
PNSFLGGSTVTNSSDVPNSQGILPSNRPNYMPTVNYLCSIPNPNFSGTPSLTNLPFLPWTIPSNSRVVFDIVFRRERRGNSCDQYIYRFQKEITASEDYSSLYDFVIGQNVNFDSGENDPNNGEGPNQNIFDPNIVQLPFNISTSPDMPQGPAASPLAPAPIVGTNQYGFVGSDVDWTGSGGSSSADYYAGKQFLQIRSGMQPCDSATIFNKPRQSILSVSVRVFTSENLLIFETIPVESDANIYYEGSDSYPITNGFHMGNAGNQTATDSAIINSSLFNCFSF